ncbi:hypothetical protein VTL71DRAFT_7526 [Oculimacula yallundae]|uniref:Uncharacterized protein n=1 Tax=Oculimacula yallundae TaxID=86028 RepID=A0ABR4BWZ0_9HELO
MRHHGRSWRWLELAFISVGQVGHDLSDLIGSNPRDRKLSFCNTTLSTPSQPDNSIKSQILRSVTRTFDIQPFRLKSAKRKLQRRWVLWSRIIARK